MTKGDPTADRTRDMQEIAAGAKMRIDIHTQGGKHLVELMEALLGDRLQVLGKSDPYCRSLLDVLENVGLTIRGAAEKSAKLLAQSAKGED